MNIRMEKMNGKRQINKVLLICKGIIKVPKPKGQPKSLTLNQPLFSACDLVCTFRNFRHIYCSFIYSENSICLFSKEI